MGAFVTFHAHLGRQPHSATGESCAHALENWLSVPFCSDAVNDPLGSLSLSDIVPPESLVSIERFVSPSALLPLPPLHCRVAPELVVLPVTVKGTSAVAPLPPFTQSLPEPLMLLPL